VDTKKPTQNDVRRMADIMPPLRSNFVAPKSEVAGSLQSQPSSLYSSRRNMMVPQYVMQLGASRESDEIPYFVQSAYRTNQQILQQKTKGALMASYDVLERPAQFSSKAQIRESFFDTVERVATKKPELPKKALSQKESLVAMIQKSFIKPLLRNVQRSLLEKFEIIVTIFSRIFSRKLAYATAGFCLVAMISFGGVSLFHRGVAMKGEVLGVSQDGYASLNAATENIKDRKFDKSALNFAQAAQSFEEASQSFDEWNATLVEVSSYFPMLSKLASGKNAVDAGKHIALAGKSINSILSDIASVKNPLDTQSTVSLLEIFQKTESNAKQASDELTLANDALNKVDVNDLPEEKRDRFAKVKDQLPQMIALMNAFKESDQIFSDLLGGNGPRKYLFLFQNNNEMRATGGFIGTYAVMDISDGRVKNFFVDGIFNPDGQLKENIVPPVPIQKMSAAWSLHDSNWFPDFPTSAEKAISFYEKTGGPTVDGVITLTPTVMQKLLRVTGPIQMDEYGKILDADNFLEEVQQQVEVDYDKTENKPKQILADLAPLLLDRIFNVKDGGQAMAIAQAFGEGLSEKHILLYSRDEKIEKIIDGLGWSGKMLSTNKDFVSVINTNINGYKTDGVIDESIEHKASIEDNGSVIDTVTVTRKHNGGYSDKEWWNKVNADYMRVYVPKGSILLSAEGQTHETVTPPIDYDKLGFKRDALVDQEEKSQSIDSATGTIMYDDGDKTVFANWIYVSPQESVTLTYTYLLPFKINPNAPDKQGFDSYSLVAQKQSGSVGSRFSSTIQCVNQLKPIWQSSSNLLPYGDDSIPDGYTAFRMQSDLTQDRFGGVVFANER
jgi:hypothetical protein